MFKDFYLLLTPKTFYYFSNRIRRVLGCFALVVMVIGWGWGLFIAPADYQQGESVRIMYVHVPAAFLSLMIYGVMAVCAAITLIWQIKMAGILQKACAQVGLMFTGIALVTGSLWGKPTWGTWWVWDARLTGELILLFIYAALLALNMSLGSSKANDRIVAVITWIGLIDLPIIHYSVEWWNTLHQGSSLLLMAKPKIHMSMLLPLCVSLFGMLCFAIWSILSLAQLAILGKEYKQQWVKELFS